MVCSAVAGICYDVKPTLLQGVESEACLKAQNLIIVSGFMNLF